MWGIYCIFWGDMQQRSVYKCKIAVILHQQLRFGFIKLPFVKKESQPSFDELQACVFAKSFLGAEFEQVFVEAVATHRGGRTQDDKAASGAGHGYVHTPQVGEEANAALIVLPHERENDDVAFLTLEGVDRVDRDTSRQRP